MFLSETDGSQGQNTKKIAYRLESFHFYHHFCNSRYPSLKKPFSGSISHQNISILHFIERTIPYFESTTNTSKKHIPIHQIDDGRLYSSLILGFYRKSKFSIFQFKNAIFYAILVVFYKRKHHLVSLCFVQSTPKNKITFFLVTFLVTEVMTLL